MNEIELEICTASGGINYKNCNIISNDTNAMTLFCAVGPFEFDAYGIYFGRTIVPQVIVDSERFYIEITNNGEYILVANPSQSCLAFQLLKPGKNWEQYLKVGKDIRFFNYTPPNEVYFSTTARANVAVLSLSIGQCNVECNFCAGCPDNSECNGIDCVNSLTSIATAFTIRYQSTEGIIKAITYTPLIGGASVNLQSVPVTQLAIKDVNQLPYPEQWFYIDSIPLETNIAYQVFIMISGEKYYLVNTAAPPKVSSTGETSIEYSLTTDVTALNILSFASPTPGNWRDFVFPPNVFITIPFLDMISMAFWGNYSLRGTPVVTQAFISTASEPLEPPIPPAPQPQPVIPIRPEKTRISIWFWIFLIIIVFLILLMIFIGFYWWRRKQIMEEIECQKNFNPGTKTGGKTKKETACLIFRNEPPAT